MAKDKKVILATHGNLADGFVSSLKIIVGEQSNLKTIPCYLTPDFNLEETIENLMSNHDFENYDLVVCTDVMGGSVNNGFIKYLRKYPFHLVTNTNLGFLIDLLLTPGGVEAQDLALKVSNDLVSVKYVNSAINSIDEEDDL